MKYGYKKRSSLPFTETVEKIKEKLLVERFGVLMEIDVCSTLKKKLDVDMSPYIILGACHPPSAYEAIKAEKEIGLMLPCNVIVYEEDGDVYISAIMPSIAMQMIENKALDKIATSIEVKLKTVIDSV